MSGVSGPTAGVSGCYTPLYWRFFTFPVVLYCARVVRVPMFPSDLSGS